MSAVSEAVATNGGEKYPFTRAMDPSISYERYRPSWAGGNVGSFGYIAESECWIDDSQGWNVRPNGADYHMYGNDDAVIDSDYLNPAWDIDMHPRWWSTYSQNAEGQTIMNMTGGVTGDGFPAAEAFVYDAHGNGIMLGVYQVPPNGWGPEPETRLFGDFQRPMIDFNVNIVVQDGVFQGVLENGAIVSIEEWNKRFTSQPSRP